MNTTTVYADYHIYDAKDAAALIAGRDIYVWGAGQKGKGFRLALERNGFSIKAFLDKSPLLKGTVYQGVPILDPQTVLRDVPAMKNFFVLVASVDKKNAEIFRECEAAGLRKGSDFINIQELSPYYPTVEISGLCNLRCINCPRGDSLHPPPRGGFMKASDYQKVAEKLVREIPFLYLVDLYIWGEPLLNPDLAEIIRINSRLGVASGISSNLNAAKHLEEVIRAAPAQIRVSLSGYGKENYETTHTGGRWEVLHKNMLALAGYIKKYRTQTLVEVYYHVNKQNIAETKNIRAMCNELGFRFHPSISMPFPPFAMDYLDGSELCQEVETAREIMLVSMEEMIETARKERHKPCLLKRVLPVINWDLTVLPCCNYSLNKIGENVVAENYLDIPLADILRLRNSNPLCVRCSELALHRYFNPEYYTANVNALIEAEERRQEASVV